MSFLDDLKKQASGLQGKAADLLGNNSEAVSGGIGKLGDLVDKATQGKFSDQISGFKEKAAETVENLGNKDESTNAEDVAEEATTEATEEDNRDEQ
ncbi:MAG: antitoxin [Micrococcaceae bacterium]